MESITRRDFVRTSVAASAAVAAAATMTVAPETALRASNKARHVKIVGICCSPRKGRTTAASLQVCLQAAKEVNPSIEVELVELAGMNIDGSLAARLSPKPGQADDFPKLVPDYFNRLFYCQY